MSATDAEEERIPLVHSEVGEGYPTTLPLGDFAAMEVEEEPEEVSGLAC